MMDDLQLLNAYVADGSEDAFRTVLERNAGLVYSAALRQTGDAHLAEEITQAVFVVLARKAGSLRSGTVLAGWLFRTTRFVAARAVRDKQLRQRREQEAAQMESYQSSSPAEASWDDIAPSLDEALAHLGQADRHAVLLRFFEKKGLKEVGRAIGSSEDAAKKRISRALDKLRGFLVRRGIVLSTLTLASVLAENSVQAAPAGVISSTFAAATAKAGTATMLALVKAALQAMFYAKVKTAAVSTGVLLAIAGTAFSTMSVLDEKPAPRFLPLPLEQLDGMPLANFPAGRLWGTLPTGSRTYGGVPFQISMRVQLHGNQDAREFRRYPARIAGIPVHERLARLHLVQGANISEREGTPVAALRLNYASGGTHTLFVVYGVHTREWWHYPNEVISAVTDPNTTVAWTGRSSDGDSNGATHRMFKTTFDLPASDEPVETIDCLSLFSRSSLIILAMTGEPGRGPIQRGAVSPDERRFRDSIALQVLDQSGQMIRGARVLGVAQTGAGEITLGKLDDTFSTSGIPIDFPAGARELRLRVTAPGYVPAEARWTAAPGERLGPRAMVHLLATEARTQGAGRESPEEARLAKASVQAAYELKRSGRHVEAIPAFEASIPRYPNHSDSYHGLAQSLRDSGSPLRALPNHDRAIELDPGRYDLYWERGLTYLRMRCFDDAIADFEACLARNHSFTNARLALVKAIRGKADFNTELPDTNFVQSEKAAK
jgi:RNA polymerase sigma factor (sigma-70 family)